MLENIRKNIPGLSGNSLPSDEVAQMEAALEGALFSVAPRPEFVQRLNRQLIKAAPLARQQAPSSLVLEQKSRDTLLIGAATLLGAAAMFATGFRVALMIFGTIGILVQWFNRKSSEKTASTQ
ncbi:MAG: hypothetical protein HUU38_24420, partial [Anaerolineales bacterium]|nr:hypothetical protein [Anaerolineales bacterium]